MGQILFGRTQLDIQTPFDGSSASPSFTSDNVRNGIIEARDTAVGTSAKGFIFCSYNGNAGTGRYFEFFNNISSNDAPLLFVGATKIIRIVSATTAANATCTIGFYDIQTGSEVLLYTQTFSAVKRKNDIGSYATPVFTIPINAQLEIKVDSGSINTPHMYFVIEG